MFSGVCQKNRIQNSFINYSRLFCTAKQSTDAAATSNFLFKPPDPEEQPHLEEVEYVGKLFPLPKLTLNNIFNAVSSQLQNQELRLVSSYKRIRHSKTSFSWMCTFNVKWPENKTFSQVASNKQEAARKASLLVLSWLKQLHKITHDGKPIVLDKQDIKELREAPFTLNLQQQTEEKLSQIVDKYDTFLAEPFEAALTQQNAENRINEQLQRLETMKIPFQQNFEGTQRYLRKMSVELPITEFKDRIVDLYKNNKVVIIKGEPGCGKSTQVPQFILEDWAVHGGPDGEPCRIVVSQPRRIAAISLATRVASEKIDEVNYFLR